VPYGLGGSWKRIHKMLQQESIRSWFTLSLSLFQMSNTCQNTCMFIKYINMRCLCDLASPLPILTVANACCTCSRGRCGIGPPNNNNLFLSWQFSDPRFPFRCSNILPTSSVGLHLFWNCTRLQFIAWVNYYNSFASHALIGCRRRSRDRISLHIPRATMVTDALCLEAFWLVTCPVAAKMRIQTSLACRNNHRRNGVLPRK
jgi:hypothetical protein